MSDLPKKRYHPALFTSLIFPFGAVGGFISVVLAYRATLVGLTVEQGAELVAVGMLPHTWKFLWAPVVDTTWTRKGWFWLANALCILGVIGLASIPLGPSTFRTMQAIVFVANLATTFLGMAVEGVMAHVTAPEDRGQAGGWFQAGNLGGGGIGGGLGLLMAERLPATWMSGVVLGLCFALSGLAINALPSVPADPRQGGLGSAILGVVRELWHAIRSREGFLAALLCFLPIGTGAAGGVLIQAEIAAAWGAGADEVAFVSGFLSGGIAAFGCLVGGVICGRFPSRLVYAGVGALMAATTAAMALAPMTVPSYIGFGLFYSFVTGLAYAAFTGLVLEVIGKSAAATKYNIFASLSNTPIAYMGLVLGNVAGAYGAKEMLLAESGAGVAGIALLAVVALAVHKLWPEVKAAPGSAS